MLNIARDGVIILFKTLKGHFRGDTENDLQYNKKRQMTKRRGAIASFKSSATAIAQGLEKKKSSMNAAAESKRSMQQIISQNEKNEEAKLKE